MTKSIRTVLSPLLLISSLCGLRIIEISAGYPKLWFSLLYIPLLWSVHCFFVINKGISYIPDESAEYIIYVSLNIFTTLLSIFFGIYYDKGPVHCWAPDVKYKSKFEDQERKNNIIMQKNKIILKKIRQAESQYPARAFVKKWKRMHEAVEHHARGVILHISIIKQLSAVLNVQKQLAEKSQIRCFFDIGLKEENQKLGRIVFELYDSIAPRTCENFAAFCRGVNGLSYKYTPFYRIVSGYWCQGGDVTKFNGTGSTSIYGDSFDKESSNLRHTGPGILSTCDNDNGTTDSKFNLTFKCLRTVNGNKTVFGRVIDGMNNIYKIEGFGTKTGKPMKSVIVLNCGVLSTKRVYI
ncbi:E3 SUMO-protein ligase RanBP2 [Cyphomyrmex costatus]|uniref:E3 SUMO-protein ligase RanBP2 n=1 Tax=Cyphomyrmex costatus TaxID=456900 RepID=A0A195C3S4_9HYME|nr:E3 SUMO-protein ligase RanBP2 [Cyphomyrmex costatus]